MAEDDREEERSARWVLAFELRRLREQSGASLAQLSEDTAYGRTYLYRLEAGEPVRAFGHGGPGPVYETGGLLVRLWGLAKQEAFADRYKLFMRYESRATIMHKYMLGIPGLLQTEDYARTVLSSAPYPCDPDAVEEQVAARLGRQELLRRDPPPSLRIILGEAALCRPTADRAFWRGQLSHLVASVGSRSLVIQVLPFAAGEHDLAGGSRCGIARFRAVRPSFFPSRRGRRLSQVSGRGSLRAPERLRLTRWGLCLDAERGRTCAGWRRLLSLQARAPLRPRFGSSQRWRCEGSATQRRGL